MSRLGQVGQGGRPVTSYSRKLRELDDIDRLIDEALDHPDRAARIKETLRQRLHGAAYRTPLRSPAGNDGGDDLWDNLPV